MELSKRQEGATCKEKKDESWDFQRSKRELSIWLPWSLSGLGCTTPLGPHQNPPNKIFTMWQGLRNSLEDSKSLGAVNGGNERGSVSSGETLRVATSNNKEKFVSCIAGGRYVTVVTTAITTSGMYLVLNLDLKKYWEKKQTLSTVRHVFGR